jgi:uncharacterized membrane protein (DUF373 family)
MEPVGLRNHYREFRHNWTTLGLYKRFEQVVALALTVLIAVVIVVAIWDLLKELTLLLAYGLLDPLDHRMFQVIFGQIMTVLIALEFNHSIIRVAAAKESIVQVKIVLLIGVLALARKLIILDTSEYSPGTILALAAALVVLGATYWLIRDPDRRQAMP